MSYLFDQAKFLFEPKKVVVSSDTYDSYLPSQILVSSESPSPFIPSLSIKYPNTYNGYNNYDDPYGATASLVFYNNLDADPKIHAQLTEYFYYKTLDKWLYDDLLDVLSFLTVHNNKVDVIKNLNDYRQDNAEKDSLETVEQKIDFIEKFIFSKEDMYRILRRYVKETGTHWYDLYKNEYFVKDMVKSYLKKQLKKSIVGAPVTK